MQTSYRGCNTDNCKGCRNKYGCQKYLGYLESIVTSTPSSVLGTTSAVTVDNSEVLGKINSLAVDVEVIKDKVSVLCNDVNAKLDFIIGNSGAYETDLSGTDMVIYSGDVPGKVFREKKGLLGLGKAKWVEEKS